MYLRLLELEIFIGNLRNFKLSRSSGRICSTLAKLIKLLL